MTFQELYNKYNPILGPNGTRSITGALVNEFITDLKSVFTFQEEQIETVKTAVTGSTSLGTITPSSTIPTEGNVWGFAAPGTYPNAGNLTVAENTMGILTRVDDVWSSVEVEMPSNTAKKVFNALDDENPSTMKAGADRWDKALEVLEGLTGKSLDLSGNIGNKTVYNKDLSVAATDDSNNTSLFKVPIASDDEFLYLKFTVPSTLAQYVNLYSCITFEKNDGTIENFKGWNIVPTKETYDNTISLVGKGYKNITITWNNNTNIIFKLLKNEVIKIEDYIDTANSARETIEGIVLDLNLSSDYTFNVVSTAQQPVSIIPKISGVTNDLFNLKLNCNVVPNLLFSENIKFIGDVLPIFASGFSYILVFQTFDFGNNWFCSVVGAYADRSGIIFKENFKQKGLITSLLSFNNNTIESNGEIVQMKGEDIGDSIFYKDLGTAYYTVSGIFLLKNERSKLIYRAVDNKNFGLIGYNGVLNKVNIINIINGVVVENIEISIPGLNSKNYASFKVKITLTTWKFFVNEILVRTFTNPTGFQGATKVGIIADTNLRDIYIKQLNASSNG